MGQSLSNFTWNALEMPKTPVANAVVELNQTKKSFHVDMKAHAEKEDLFSLYSGFTCGILSGSQYGTGSILHEKQHEKIHSKCHYIAVLS